MDRMLLPIFGSIFLFIMGAAGIFVWDRHPPLDFNVPFPMNLLPGVPGHVHWGSLASDRNEAQAKADAAVLQAQRWQMAVNTCNASVDALKADSDRKLAKAEAQVRAEEGAAKKAMQSVSSLLAFKPAGATSCERTQSMFDYIKKDLNQ